MEKLPEEGQPNFEVKAEQEVQQPLTVEDLRKKREELETKVSAEKQRKEEDITKRTKELEAQATAIKKQKEEDVAKQLGDREVIVAEGTKIIPLLEEAESTLEYFETQDQLELLTDEKDIAELENLRTLVASLQEQKEAIRQKHEEIMSNPDVYEKVWEEAHQEKGSKELKEKQKEATQELQEATQGIQERIGELVRNIESLAGNREASYSAVKKGGDALEDARTRVRQLINEACDKLGSSEYKTAEFLKSSTSASTYGECLTNIEQYRESLGLFKGKEKAVIDYIVRNKGYKFVDADKAIEEYNNARQYLQTLNAKVDELAEQYKTIVLDAWDKEREIRTKFSLEKNTGLDSLPNRARNGVECELKKEAGLLIETDKGWQELNANHWGAKAAHEKFDKSKNLFSDIEEKTGRGLYYRDPGEQRHVEE